VDGFKRSHFIDFQQYLLIVKNDTLPAMENPFVEWQEIKIDNRD
jgi:patatin-like phospholipase/acyl hydrolase